MRTFGKVALAALFASSSLLVACDSNDGPVEKAGEKVDEAVESMSPEKGPMEEMGEDLDNAYDSAKDSAESMKDAAPLVNPLGFRPVMVRKPGWLQHLLLAASPPNQGSRVRAYVSSAR